MGGSSSKENIRMLNKNVPLTHDKLNIEIVDKVMFKF